MFVDLAPVLKDQAQLNIERGRDDSNDENDFPSKKTRSQMKKKTNVHPNVDDSNQN